jgi:prolipoprotein diacylglyceryl transferase
LLIAQGIGRFGNWFNAELFGKPTTFFWALEIPRESRPSGFENFATFHPTFLYEAIWCFFVAAIIMKLKFFKKFVKAGTIFIFYVLAYSLGRFFIESIRIDESNLILGLRLNIWVSGLLFFGALAVLIRRISGNTQKS